MGITVSKTAKKYKTGNITAAFGSDLFLQGSTTIPNLLLKFYSQLGIDDSEMMLLIQLIRLRTEDKNFFPSLEVLYPLLSGSEEQIENSLESLLRKELIKVSDFFDAEREVVFKGYDFEPLFEKLSEVWACAKVQENQNIRKFIEVEQFQQASINLFKNFESEFGRPLSPMEIDQINSWSRRLQPFLVLEALRRAVLLGKHNFKYIDSILREWEKNNITSVCDIEEYDRRFKNKQPAKKKLQDTKENNKQNNKKSLIKSLYMN
ncbi:DnaD domain-containing protein [Desulfotruncus alcoholivorax]|uniref:DnaD domain-containing protein n=1 Tax=Desulfotruncus alcoholivorax TaxID=265477 RepID=UPI0004872151|nr:DnaD domain protein [Desulfotruncus alcoholivorax]